ncbi:MAG: glycosyltransferase [Desulfobulbaceae bacterium]|nr:glycosyltransferase [Desulfobulbaceae bacterium]
MRLIVTGGGTGGHLFPAIAVACGVRQRAPGSAILFVGTGRQIDNRVLAGLGFSREILSFSGVKGLGISGALRSGLRLPQAAYMAAKIIQRFRPDLVFAVGGYVTGPVLLAAKLFRVPICIHEQNSVPGLANRLAGKIADRVCISLPCKPPFAEKKTVLTGNPVREEILGAAEEKNVSADRELTLLILGGSQGAHRVTALML